MLSCEIRRRLPVNLLEVAESPNTKSGSRVCFAVNCGLFIEIDQKVNLKHFESLFKIGVCIKKKKSIRSPPNGYGFSPSGN